MCLSNSGHPCLAPDGSKTRFQFPLLVADQNWTSLFIGSADDSTLELDCGSGSSLLQGNLFPWLGILQLE